MPAQGWMKTRERYVFCDVLDDPGPCAPQDGLHPQHQFINVEGLAQIIVGARLKTGDPVLGFYLGGQEQDGNML